MESADRLKWYLDQKASFYNHPSFIDSDPISVPHRFSRREDIEISGFLTATIAWGNRKSIIANGLRLTGLMEGEPFQFLMNARQAELKPFSSFVHRTFNGDDCLFFIHSLQIIYREYGSLEPLFDGFREQGAAVAIHRFREYFFRAIHMPRTRKHVADPLSGSSAKRINMFLRWMVRRDDRGVDFGLWKTIDTADLVCPLDIHSGRIARQLGLLLRRQDDWKAAQELNGQLRQFDPKDPVKYDYALFGIGVFEKQVSV